MAGWYEAFVPGDLSAQIQACSTIFLILCDGMLDTTNFRTSQHPSKCVQFQPIIWNNLFVD